MYVQIIIYHRAHYYNKTENLVYFKVAHWSDFWLIDLFKNEFLLGAFESIKKLTFI